ncbi:hypothetical protein V6259_09035 [Marinomonas sp. TI.3.20]|uniref:hypothetical protein n=1 Tax=Marinomonas sp. TI.3.20 TaxID=3121296 RepID=UPI0031201F81
MFKLIGGILFAFIISVAPSAYAIEVTPMVVTFSPQDTTRTPFSVIYNQLPRDVAFNIQVYDVKFDKTGKSKPTLVPLDNSPLWVFPPSLYLKAGTSQRIQFRWIGKTMPTEDKTYQVSLIEQPIENTSTNKTSKLTILLDVNLIVHLNQNKFKPDVKVEKTYSKNGDLYATILNSGPGSSRLSDYDSTIFENGKRLKNFKKQELKSQGYDVFFPPYSAMDVKIPFSKSLKKNKNNELTLKLME